MSYESIEKLIFPVASIICSFFIGIIFDTIIFKYLKKLARRTTWEGDDIIIEALRGKLIIWFILGGLYIGLLNVQVSHEALITIQMILLVIFVLSVSWVLAKITAGLINLYLKKREGVFPSVSIFTNLAKVLIYILGILVILQSFGISITPILTALGVGGLAVALALQDTLSNLFAGLQILASKQIKPGDYVKLSTGEEGIITDITWRNTSITQLSNNTVIIPNSKISTSIVINYFLPDKEMTFSVPVCVSYNNDLKKVEEITIQTAKQIIKEVAGGIAHFEPVVRFHTFSDFNIKFNVVFKVSEYTNQFLITHEFLKRLHAIFIEKGIILSSALKLTT